MGTVCIVSFERKKIKIEVLTSQRLYMLDFCPVPSVCMIPKLYLTNTKYLVDFLKA